MRVLKNIGIGMLAATGFVLFGAFFGMVGEGFSVWTTRAFIEFAVVWAILVPILIVLAPWYLQKSEENRIKARIALRLKKLQKFLEENGNN